MIFHVVILDPSDLQLRYLWTILCLFNQSMYSQLGWAVAGVVVPVFLHKSNQTISEITEPPLEVEI